MTELPDYFLKFHGARGLSMTPGEKVIVMMFALGGLGFA